MKAVVRLRKDLPYRRATFVAGLQAVGYRVVDGSESNTHWAPDDERDLLVLWNKKHGHDETMADVWERKGGTVVVVENGYLQREPGTIFAISTHGHNGSGWFPVDTEDRFTMLGFPLKDLRLRSPGRILVVGQRSIGSKLMASPQQWGELQTSKLQRAGYDAMHRPHPGNFPQRQVPLEVDLANVDAVNIWSSTVGVRALVEGLPVKSDAPFWICRSLGPREPALHEMSHGQWTAGEIASGEPFARMAAHNWGPTWA